MHLKFYQMMAETINNIMPVVGYESFYLISDNGTITSKDRKIATRWGGFFIRKARIMKTKLDRYGYKCVGLMRDDGVKKYFTTHRLVGLTFIQNPYNLPQVNHKNNIKTDNRVENLKWGTVLSNSSEAAQDGLYKPIRGSKNASSILTESDVSVIRKIYAMGNITQREIAKKYKVHYVTIWDIIHKKNWAHI